MQKEYDVAVEWQPFELHPGIPPEGKELPAYVRANSGINDRLREMARASGREMIMPERMISSRRALEASEYAREQGKHDAFHRIVFRKFYGEGQDMSDWAVLRAAAEEAGLDPDEMQRETESGRYEAIVDAKITAARDEDIGGVPTYVFDDKYDIMGVQPYEVFQRVMARLKAESNID